MSIIGNHAFSSCDNLESVTSIGSGAFYNCSLLTSLTIQAITPPTLGDSVFAGTSSSLVIYVPSELVETYKSANEWSDYASRIQAITKWSLAI